MTAFKRNGKWSAKFVSKGAQHWVKGGPWETKKAAQKAEHVHRARLEGRRDAETCATFADRWLSEWPRAAVSSQANYASCARRFAEHFGDTPLSNVDRLAARSWALSVPRGLPRVIATMFEDARDVGLVTENPFHRLRLSVNRNEVSWPSLEDYRRLVASCHVLDGYAPEFRAMIQFSAWTGIREGELCGLQWDDVEAERIWVRRQRRKDGSIAKPKGSYVEPMPFPPPARVLDDLPRRPDPFVFHSPRGRPLRDHSHREQWIKVREEAGLDLRWHSLRHFCATQLLEMGLDHFTVSIQLRHHDGGALVMKRYGHPSREAAHERVLRAFDFDVEVAA